LVDKIERIFIVMVLPTKSV